MAAQGCFSTNATKSCYEFDLYLGPVIENSAVLFSDPVSFDEFMTAKLNSTSILTDLNCDITKSTYHGTIAERRLYYCAYYAAASTQCDAQNMNKNYLCQSTCLDYAHQIEQTVFPGTGCVETQIGIRQSSLDSITNSCSKATLPQFRYLESTSTSTCIKLSKASPIDSSSSANSGANASKNSDQGIPVYTWVLASFALVLVVVVLGYFGIRKYKNEPKSILGPVIDITEISKTEFQNEAPKNKAASLEGQNVLAIHPYNATRDDEIDLAVGDMLRVTTEYGDSWCLGYNLTKQQEGMFPSVCIHTKDGGKF